MRPGLLIAAPRSGAGKTTVTLGLLAAFRARGVDVRGAKSGPDYIDGAFHERATGSPSANLDSWAMDRALLARFADGPGDLLLVEAAMGLFDGAGIAGPGGADGSAASLAQSLALPVVLVLDVSGQAQSAAAVAHGFATFDPAVTVVGVILNRVAGDRHRARAEAAMARTGIPVLGAIAREAGLALPERHLGLVQAGEHADLAERLAHLGARVGSGVDLDALRALARPVGTDRPGVAAGAASGAPALPPPGGRIAIARDEAFSFVYPHVLAGWRASGATIVPFSPLADEAPDASADACWLPGGYPELHAGRLAAGTRWRDGVRALAAGGAAVHGECGGFMALGRAMIDAAGVAHPMLDLLDHETSFAQRGFQLGYREARLAATSVLGPAGGRIAGHEFHHASLSDPGTDAPLATVTDGDGRAIGPQGGVRGRVSGGFFHAIATVAV